MRTHFAPATILALVLWLFMPGRILAQGTTVVGDGTPAICTAAALANAVAADGMITFDCGPAPVTIAGGPYAIDGDVALDGGGLVTLSGEGAHRLFHVQLGASLRLANLTLTDGSAVEGAGSILNEGALVLDTVVIRDSKTTGADSGGGAIANLGGTLTIFGSQLLANEAAFTGGALLLHEGVTVIDNSVIDGNTAQAFGAIDTTGDLTIRNTMIRGNRATAADGGGVGVVKGVALIEGSLIEGNFSGGGGGGVYSGPNYPGTTVTIRDTRIAQNEADSAFAGSLGGGIFSGARLTLERVTVEGNRSYSAGGLFQYGGEGRLTVSDATFSNNSAVHVAGGFWLNGALGHHFTNVTISANTAGDWAGGVYGVDYPAELQNVTIFGNRAQIGANLYNVRTTSTFTSTLIGDPQGGGANCGAADSAQPARSGGHNLVSDATCGLNEDSDQSGVGLLLGPLVDNGGTTQTHLPLAGSPAIDAAETACPGADQRGYVRPAGAACDAGAVEVGAAPPSPPEEEPLPPLQRPVAINYVWQGNLNQPVIQYPLSQVMIPGVVDPLLNKRRGVDATICLYRTDLDGATNPKREPYEEIIGFFADGLYEMTNGAHILRYVTITYGCRPGISRNITGTDTVVTVDTADSFAADIIWGRKLWPNAALSGYANAGSHLFMADTLMNFDPHMDALTTTNHAMAGYTLAHEWGHYMYGLRDEYPRASTPCDDEVEYQGPCANDTGVVPSIMSCQLRAVLGFTCGTWSEGVKEGYAWLNFSSAANSNQNNAHYRLYQADAWTVLSRPLSADPPEIYRQGTRALRHFFEELRAFAPASNQAPQIDLVTDPAAPTFGIPRRALQIIWRREGTQQGGGGEPALEPKLSPFHRCLTCPVAIFQRNEFLYPNPVEFRLGLERELPIANMQVIATVQAPDGSQYQAPVIGDSVGGYVAQLPYGTGGLHQVTFLFTNPDLKATFTNAGIDYAPAMGGEEPPTIETPVGVPFTVTVSTVYTVTGFQADDHADTPAGATSLTTDNEPLLGRSDRGDDVDVFTATAGVEGLLVVRVVDLTPGMRTKLTIRNDAGDLLFDGVIDDQNGAPYLFARLTLTPGTAVTIAVADAAGVPGATYQVSAGAALETQAEQGSSLFLPVVTR